CLRLWQFVALAFVSISNTLKNAFSPLFHFPLSLRPLIEINSLHQLYIISEIAVNQYEVSFSEQFFNYQIINLKNNRCSRGRMEYKHCCIRKIFVQKKIFIMPISELSRS